MQKNSGVTNRRMLFSRPMQSHNKNLYKRRQRHETTLLSFWVLRETTSICETTCSVFRVFFLLLVCSSWWRLNKMLAYLKERKVSKSLVFPFVKAIWKTCYRLQLGVLRQYVTSTCVNALSHIFFGFSEKKTVASLALTYMFNPHKSFRNKFHIPSTHGLLCLYSVLSCTGQVSMPQDYYPSLWFGVEFFCNNV